MEKNYEEEFQFETSEYTSPGFAEAKCQFIDYIIGYEEHPRNISGCIILLVAFFVKNIISLYIKSSLYVTT